MITIILRNIWLSYLFIFRRATPDFKKSGFHLFQFIAEKM